MNKIVRKEVRLPILIFLIMFSTDAGIVTINNDRTWARITWVFIIGLFCYFVFTKRLYKKISILYCTIFSASILCTMLLAERVININYIQRIILIFTAFFVVEKFSYHHFMNEFVNLMRFICIVSLFGIVFHKVICSMNFFPKFYSSDFAYEFLVFTNIPHYSTRNFGPFWEPGAFQLYINFALLYEIRNIQILKIKDIVLFSVTILTTKSTAGIILLCIILVYFVFMKISKYKKALYRNMKIVLFIAAIVGVFFVLQSDSFINQVFGKITAFFENTNTMNSANVSAYVRFKGVMANIILFFEKPLLGWGIEGVIQEFDDRYGFTTNTCTILAAASTYGVVPFILYNFLWIKAIFTEKTIGRGIVLGFAFIVSLFTENLLVSFLFWIILIYESNIVKREKIF